MKKAMNEKRKEQRVLGNAQQGHVGILTDEDIQVLDTTGGFGVLV